MSNLANTAVKLPHDHPVYHPKQLSLLTPQMEELEKQLMRSVWNGRTGIWVDGDARIGKTTAIESILGRFTLRSGIPVPYVHVDMPEQPSSADHAALYRTICSQLSLSTKRGDSVVLRERVASHMSEIEGIEQARTVILCIDNAHFLTDRQWSAASALGELLLKQTGYHLIQIHVLDKNWAEKPMAMFKKEKYKFLAGRAKEVSINYRGFSTSTQLKSFLHQWDEAKLPPDESVSMTEAILPTAYAKGWRLSNFAVEIWECYRHFQSEHRLGDWNTKYVVDSLLYLLCDLLHEKGVDALSQDLVMHAIQLGTPNFN